MRSEKPVDRQAALVLLLLTIAAFAMVLVKF
jgi:hypothetical protein